VDYGLLAAMQASANQLMEAHKISLTTRNYAVSACTILDAAHPVFVSPTRPQRPWLTKLEPRNFESSGGEFWPTQRRRPRTHSIGTGPGRSCRHSFGRGTSLASPHLPKPIRMRKRTTSRRRATIQAFPISSTLGQRNSRACLASRDRSSVTWPNVISELRNPSISDPSGQRNPACAQAQA
jgi:hypothetical protein